MILFIYSQDFNFFINNFPQKNVKFLKLETTSFFSIIYHLIGCKKIFTNSRKYFFLYKLFFKTVYFVNYNNLEISENYAKIYSTFPIKKNFIPTGFCLSKEFSFTYLKFQKKLNILLEKEGIVENLPKNHSISIELNAKNIKENHFIICSAKIENIAAVCAIGRPALFIATNEIEKKNAEYIIELTKSHNFYSNLEEALNFFEKNENAFHQACQNFHTCFLTYNKIEY